MLQDTRLSPRDRALLAMLFEMIGQRFHMEFRTRLERLKAMYEPFDPDLDTVSKVQANGHAVGWTSESVVEGISSAELSKSFEQLLLDANYQEMAREQIVACTEFQANRNITAKASFSDYADLRIFYRGVRHETRSYHGWNSWRRKEETVHVFARLALLVRLRTREPRSVFLKLFKDVVAEDLEMLLPYVRIRMKMLDRLKIGTSVVGSLATASWKAWTATMLSPWLLAVVARALPAPA